MTDAAIHPRRQAILVATLIVAGMVAYYPSFQGKFVFDDVYQVADADGTPQLESMGSEIYRSRRPLLYISLWVNHRLGGLHEWGYHVFNLLVHLAAGLTLFGIVARTLTLPPQGAKYAGSARMLAFVVALIWLVHPLQTQAVTYVVQRCESMMGLCYLLTIYCVLRGARSSRPWAWYAAGIAACSLGMGCKEVMITAPLVVLLYDRIFLSDTWKQLLTRRWWFYAGLSPAVIWLMALTFGHAPAAAGGGDVSAGFQYTAVTPLQYLATQPGVILHYLRLSLLPAELCFDYDWPVARTWAAILVPGAVVVGLLVASLVLLRLRPRVGFVAIAFFLILAPTSSFMPIADMAFEHRMYLPLASVIILAVLGGAFLGEWVIQSPRSRTVGYVAIVALVALMLITRTFVRNRLYTMPLALWSNVLAHSPNSPRAHINYGVHLARIGNLDEGISHFRQALQLRPDSATAHDNLGRLLARTPDRQGAIEHFRRVRDLRPKWGSPYYHLGILLMREGDVEAALVNLQRAHEIKPEHPGCNYRLGAAYKTMQQYPLAEKHLRLAIEGQPEDPKAVRVLAETFSLQGKSTLAEAQFERALRLKPDDAQTYTLYGAHFARQQEDAKAIACYQKALAITPDYGPAKTRLAELQQRQDGAVHTSGTAPPPASPVPADIDAAVSHVALPEAS